jgi:uncharacterized protein (TIGR02145 family)
MNYFKSKFSLLLAFVLAFAGACNDKGDDTTDTGKTNAVFNSKLVYGTVKDQDSISYQTIKIGNQTWMAENLRTTKYNDGSFISNIKDNNAWNTSTTGAFSTYKNSSYPDSIATFGRFYNWYAVNTGKLAPKGWHVPSQDEWNTLITYLGGSNTAAYKLFETGVTHWASPNSGATNESGFTLLAGGYRDQSGSFVNLNEGANLWTSSSDNNNTPLRVYFLKNDSKAYSYTGVKNFGFSIRCVKD